MTIFDPSDDTLKARFVILARDLQKVLTSSRIHAFTHSLTDARSHVLKRQRSIPTFNLFHCVVLIVILHLLVLLKPPNMLRRPNMLTLPSTNSIVCVFFPFSFSTIAQGIQPEASGDQNTTKQKNIPCNSYAYSACP
jgi:hypothetical protein